MQVTINDKSYGLHWGLGAFEIASEIFDFSADFIFNNAVIYEQKDGEINFDNPLMVANQAVFGAIINYCEQNDEKLDLTYAKFRNAYNDFDLELQKEILEDFKKSKYVGHVVSDLLDEAMAKLSGDKKSDVSEPLKKNKATSRKSSKTV